MEADHDVREAWPKLKNIKKKAHAKAKVFNNSLAESDCENSQDDIQIKKQSKRAFATNFYKPRFKEGYLLNKLKLVNKGIQSRPIEYFEVKLYELNNHFTNIIQGEIHPFQSILEFHHIYQLMRNIDLAVEEKREKVLLAREAALAHSPNIEIEYNFMRDCLDLMNGLIAKWKLTNKEHYLYRCSGRVLTIRMLNLEEMNNSYMTMEGLWLCLKADEEPMHHLMNESINQYSKILRKAFISVLNFMMQFNNIDFDSQPSIEGYMANKQRKLLALGMVADPSAQKPVYTSLSYTWKHYASMFMYKDMINEFQQELKGLEMAYRSFEKEMVLCILKKCLKKN